MIVKRGGKFVVTSEDGSKELGTYDTEHEAKERLRQIEAAKAAKGDGGEVAKLDVGGRLGRVERTGSGAIRVDARMTRVGVFKYTRPDGTVSREYRAPEEVFHPDSLASLADLPVTIRHPHEKSTPGQPVRLFVDPASFRTESVGHVSGQPKADGRFVAGKVVVGDGAAIAKIDAGDLAEISLGYTSRDIAAPGVTPDGEAYDVRQTHIRYNHLALGPKGWARAGRDAAIKLDASLTEVDDFEPQPAPETAPVAHTDGVILMKPTIKIDGVEYPLTTPAEIEAACRAFDRYETAQRAKLDTATGEAAALKAKLDSVTGERDGLKAKLDAASDPKTLDAAVARRQSVIDRARKLAPSAKLDGLTEREVMCAALGDKFEGQSDAYVGGMFDARTAASASAPKVDAAARQATAPVPGAGPVEQPKVDADAARLAAEKESREAWRKPLSATK